MSAAEKESTPTKWIRFWAILNGLLVVGLVAAAISGPRGVVRYERLSDELARLRALNQELEQSNRHLRREVNALKQNPQHVEAVIRDELGWVRDDEMVFIAPGGEKETR